MHYMHAFLAPAALAYAFLARVLRTAAPSLAGVLSGTRPASLRSYSKGSYHPCFTVYPHASRAPGVLYAPTSSVWLACG